MSRFHDYLSRRNAQGSSNSLAEAAIALGVPVFPCDAKKRPLTEHGFKDATRDAEAIRQMFRDPRAVMIGMPTGEVTGVVVIDVDMKPGQQGGAWLDANSHRMPQTRTIRTASGGLHIYLIWPGQRVKNSASKIAPNVDVRGDGGYVIVPPSSGYAIADNAPVAEVSEWLLAALCPPELDLVPSDGAASQPRPTPTRREGASALGHGALTARCHEIRTAADGAKHRAINEAAFAIGGLVSAGDIEEAYAWAELRDALTAILPRCKDQRAAEKTLARAFREGIARPQMPAPMITPLEEIHPAAPFLAKLARKALKPLAVTPDLMDVPGALRLFIDHCERTAISPQPFLSLAAGICLVGALAGRRYRTMTDLRSNVYAVGIADSGAGKDHARKQIKRVLYAAGLAQYLGGSDIASGSALRTALARHPAMLFQIDEFGDWLREVLGDKAASHRKQIAAILKELFSSANLPWQGIEYADQSTKGRPREDILQPHACLYGTTTPGQFWAAVAGGSLHDGLMARLLLFVSPVSYPDEQEPSLAEPPEALLVALQAIAAGAAGQGNLSALMLSTAAPDPLTVPETAEATEARRAMRREQLDQQREAEGTYVTAIAARLAENAMKLALIRAVSREPSAPVIEASDVAWGRAVTQHCIDTLLREAGRHVADNEYEAKLNRAMDIIRKHGPLTEREMIRRGFKLPERERAELLRTLIESGSAIAEQPERPPGPGRPPAIRYSVGITA